MQFHILRPWENRSHVWHDIHHSQAPYVWICMDHVLRPRENRSHVWHCIQHSIVIVYIGEDLISWWNLCLILFALLIKYNYYKLNLNRLISTSCQTLQFTSIIVLKYLSDMTFISYYLTPCVWHFIYHGTFGGKPKECYAIWTEKH
jgi:hypothetical protein